MRKVLLLYAHPAPHKSRVNRQLVRAARDLPGVTLHDLYEAYPDLDIDVRREQERLRAHDVILFQHPFYWYSTPAIVKEWIDLVLEYGWAYGEGGHALAGKAWVHALTAGGPEAQSLTAAVALSMFLAPLLIQGCFRWVLPRFAARKDEREADAIDERENPVIVAGFGRFGQMVTRLLRSNGFRATVLDFDVDQIELVRRFGNKAFYGDASRMDLLRSAGAEQARLLLIVIDDKEKATEIVEQARKEFPKLRIMARAFDRVHAYELIHRGVERPYIETAGSALWMGIDALRALGVSGKQAVRAAQVFNRHNNRSIVELARVYHEVDEAAYMTHVKSWLAALEDTLKADMGSLREELDHGWESPPRSEAQRAAGEPQSLSVETGTGAGGSSGGVSGGP
jgi:voltage-gated potassium channel Kch